MRGVQLIKISAKIVRHRCYVSDGRGSDTAADVRRHSVADRLVARAARAVMTEQSRQVRQTTTAKVCFDAAQ